MMGESSESKIARLEERLVHISAELEEVNQEIRELRARLDTALDELARARGAVSFIVWFSSAAASVIALVAAWWKRSS